MMRENRLVSEECRSCLFPCLLPFNNSLRLICFQLGVHGLVRLLRLVELMTLDAHSLGWKCTKKHGTIPLKQKNAHGSVKVYTPLYSIQLLRDARAWRYTRYSRETTCSAQVARWLNPTTQQSTVDNQDLPNRVTRRLGTTVAAKRMDCTVRGFGMLETIVPLSTGEDGDLPNWEGYGE
jgi:hypothetical protein